MSLNDFVCTYFNLLFQFLIIVEAEPPRVNPCEPSPCGPNSQCREVNGHAVCSCVIGYIGSPPSCKPECTVSSDCALDKACINLKCRDPCPGTCGLNARCQVTNHNPICSCQPGYSGDPFIRCSPIPSSKNLSLPFNFHELFTEYTLQNYITKQGSCASNYFYKEKICLLLKR